MADVRLTAINPEDSSVVAVACNDKGELKLEEIPSFDGNVDGDLTVSGSATFAGGGIALAGTETFGLISATRLVGKECWLTPDSPGNTDALKIINSNDDSESVWINGYGSATFAGYVDVGTGWITAGSRAGVRLDPAGGIYVNRAGEGTGGQIVLRAEQNGGAAGDNIQLELRGDGSATFAGGKCGFTSAGELFVTVRGRKYKTISVASGIMSWEEITLREQLEGEVQIDPNFGVSPETDTGTP